MALCVCARARVSVCVFSMVHCRFVDCSRLPPHGRPAPTLRVFVRFPTPSRHSKTPSAVTWATERTVRDASLDAQRGGDECEPPNGEDHKSKLGEDDGPGNHNPQHGHPKERSGCSDGCELQHRCSDLL